MQRKRCSIYQVPSSLVLVINDSVPYLTQFAYYCFELCFYCAHSAWLFVQHLGTISFGEFSAVLEQSSPVPHSELGSTEAAGKDISDVDFIQSSSHSLIAG